MITIRPYCTKDFKFVQDICVATSNVAQEDTPINRATLCALYCDYFLNVEPEFCFVAEGDDGIPVGCVFCTANLDLFTSTMEQDYLPLARKLNSGAYYDFVAQRKVEQRHVNAAGYTSRIYLNVLPDYRRQGVGTKLLQAIESKLTQSFIEGEYVVCGKRNVEGVSFCQKLGFDDVDYVGGSVVYGKKLFSEEE